MSLLVGNVWQEDSPMPDRPLTVHCSGLGGELLSPEYEYDIFFQNHSQMKVYGPSLAIRPPHPTWVTAVRQIFRCYHPSGQTAVSASLFSTVCDCARSSSRGH